MSWNSLLLSYGPSIWWALDEASNASPAADASGNSRPGTYMNAPTVNQTGLVPNNPAGKSILLDGVNQYVRRLTESWMTAGFTDFTIGAVVKPNTVDGARREVVGLGQNIQIWTNYPVAGRATFWMNEGTGNKQCSSSVVVMTDAVTKDIIATYNGSVMKLYVEGVEVASFTVSGTPVVNATGFTAGHSSSSMSDGYWKGNLDEPFFIVGTALSAAQVLALHDERVSAPVLPPTDPGALLLDGVALTSGQVLANPVDLTFAASTDSTSSPITYRWQYEFPTGNGTWHEVTDAFDHQLPTSSATLIHINVRQMLWESTNEHSFRLRHRAESVNGNSAWVLSPSILFNETTPHLPQPTWTDPSAYHVFETPGVANFAWSAPVDVDAHALEYQLRLVTQSDITQEDFPELGTGVDALGDSHLLMDWSSATSYDLVMSDVSWVGDAYAYVRARDNHGNYSNWKISPELDIGMNDAPFKPTVSVDNISATRVRVVSSFFSDPNDSAHGGIDVLQQIEVRIFLSSSTLDDPILSNVTDRIIDPVSAWVDLGGATGYAAYIAGLPEHTALKVVIRHRDDHSSVPKWSPWSDPFSFTTTNLTRREQIYDELNPLAHWPLDEMEYGLGDLRNTINPADAAHFANTWNNIWAADPNPGNPWRANSGPKPVSTDVTAQTRAGYALAHGQSIHVDHKPWMVGDGFVVVAWAYRTAGVFAPVVSYGTGSVVTFVAGNTVGTLFPWSCRSSPNPSIVLYGVTYSATSPVPNGLYQFVYLISQTRVAIWANGVKILDQAPSPDYLRPSNPALIDTQRMANENPLDILIGMTTTDSFYYDVPDTFTPRYASDGLHDQATLSDIAIYPLLTDAEIAMFLSPPDIVVCDEGYRLTLFEEDDTTPILGYLDDAGAIVEATFYSSPNCPRPFLKIPEELSNSEVDFRNGKSTIGGVTIEIVDVPTDDTDQLSGIVTSIVDKLPYARALFEVWDDANALWRTVFDGVVFGDSIDNRWVTFSFQLRDIHERAVERSLFTTNEGFALFPQQGPRNGYFFDGRDWFLPPVGVQRGTFTLKGASDSAGRSNGYVSTNQIAGKDSPPSYVIDAGVAQPSADIANAHWEYPDVVVRWRLVGTGETPAGTCPGSPTVEEVQRVLDNAPQSALDDLDAAYAAVGGTDITDIPTLVANAMGGSNCTLDTAEGRHLNSVLFSLLAQYGGDTEEGWTYLRKMHADAVSPSNAFFAFYNPELKTEKTDTETISYYKGQIRVLFEGDTTQLPNDGDDIEFQVLSGRPPTDDTPLYYEGTFGQLAKDAYDGELTDYDPRLRYNVTAMADFVANTPIARLIRNSPVENMFSWLEENIYKPLRAAPLIDENGLIKPSFSRVPPAGSILPVLDNSNLTIDTDWTRKTEDAVSAIEMNYKREYLTTEVVNNKDVAKLASRDVIVVHRNISSRMNNSVVYKPETVRAIGTRDGAPVISVDTEVGAQIARAAAAELFPRYPLGSLTITAKGDLSDAALADAHVGDWRVCQITWLPDTTRKLRSMDRVVQIVSMVARYDGWANLVLLDGGANDDTIQDPDIADPLTLDADGRVVVTTTLIPSNVSARIEYAFVLTAPSADSSEWKLLVVTDQLASFKTPIIPDGKTAFVRWRGESSGIRPGAWLGPLSIAASSIPRVWNVHVEVDETTGVRRVTWDANANTAAVRVYYYDQSVGLDPIWGPYVTATGDAGEVITETFAPGPTDQQRVYYVKVEPWDGDPPDLPAIAGTPVTASQMYGAGAVVGEYPFYDAAGVANDIALDGTDLIVYTKTGARKTIAVTDWTSVPFVKADGTQTSIALV